MSVILVIVVSLIVACVLFYRLWFLRTPTRYPSSHPHAFLSPASGQIFSVIRTDDTTIPIIKKDRHVLDIITQQLGGSTKGPYTVISIMMTPMDVHIQRASTQATCLSTTYRSGSFLNAISPETKHIAVWRNEANTMIFEDKDSRYAIIQIAGFLARKIQCYIKPQQSVNPGEPIGFIILGSQVTVVVDSSIDVLVSEGQYVIDGESILGWRKK